MLKSLIAQALLPALIGGAVAAPLLFVAHNNGFGSAMKEVRGQYLGYRQNELLLWSTIDDLNRKSIELAEKFEGVLDASDESRRKFKTELSIYIQQRNEGREAAKRALELIDHLKETDNWAADPVSPDIVCVRNDRAGCSDRLEPADRDLHQPVLEPASDDG